VVDITHQVKHWRDGASEEWSVCQELLEKGRLRHALFFAHLALEKALKARVCERTQDLAPRTHNLVRLAQVAEVEVTEERMRVLAALNEFSQAGRYPDSTSPTPTAELVKQRVDEADEVFRWLMSAP
jgi:HEPN domain-containing protein